MYEGTVRFFERGSERMKYTDLSKMDMAPESGWMLAYLRKNGVIFKPYTDKNAIEDMVGAEEILELHLFDQNKEYRALATESPRFDNGVIEHIADFSDDDNTVYRQKTIPEDGNFSEDLQTKLLNSIVVLNHLSFDRQGMATIDDYRMIVEEK